MGATPKAAVVDDEILEVLSSSDEAVDDRRGWGEAWRRQQSSLDTWKVSWGVNLHPICPAPRAHHHRRRWPRPMPDGPPPRRSSIR
jgi:hypothetical protein